MFWLQECPGLLLGCCFIIASVFWMVARVLLDGCYGVTRVFRMVARGVLWWLVVTSMLQGGC